MVIHLTGFLVHLQPCCLLTRSRALSFVSKTPEGYVKEHLSCRMLTFCKIGKVVNQNFT